MNIIKNTRDNLKAAGIQYNLSPKIFIILYVLLFVFLTSQILLATPNFEEYQPIFWGENKILENVQFVIFFLGAVLGLDLALKLHLQYEKSYVWGFYTLFSLILFFIAMEEIAWGQQFLHFNSPEFVKSFNAQNEVTLHNVEALQGRSNILNLIFGLGGIIGIWVGRMNKFRKIGVPAILGLLAAIIVIMSVVSVSNDFSIIETQMEYIVSKQTEPAEFLIGVFGFFYIWLNKRKYIGAPLKTKKIRNVFVDSTGLRITYETMQQFFLPHLLFPWWKNSSQEKLQGFKMDKSEKCVRWDSIPTVVCTKQVIKNQPDEQDVARLEETLLSKTILFIGLTASLLTLIWILLIPSDPENVLIFGRSAIRLGMIFVAFIFLLVFGSLLVRASWRKTVSHWINTLLASPFRRILFLVLGFGVFFAAMAVLYYAFTIQDPYIRGILSRFAPFSFFASVISFELILFALFRSRDYARLSLAAAREVRFSDDQISLVLADHREVSMPLAMVPRIKQASDQARQNFKFIGKGIKVYWSELGEEMIVPQIAVGNFSSISSNEV